MGNISKNFYIFILNYNVQSISKFLICFWYFFVQFTDQILLKKTGSVHYTFYHVALKNEYYQSNFLVTIRLGTKFDYPTINLTLVKAVFFLVCKLHIFICKSYIDHVIPIKIYRWPQKMMVYHWCKFQVFNISKAEKIEGGALCGALFNTFSKNSISATINRRLIKKLT